MYTYEKKGKEGQLKVKISAEVWEKAVEEAYQKNKGKYNIQGFRKGKAPRKVIEQNYGDTIFFDEAFEEAVSAEYAKFLAENHDVQPASMPKVEMNSFTADKGIEATLTFALMPEVTLGSLSGLTSKVKSVKITEKMVEEELKKAQETHARYVESEEVLANGDFATIDFSGSVDGVKFEGGTSEDYRLELGSHTFIEGFEDQIVGMKKGEQKDVNVVFPKEYHAEELKGKPAVFAVTVKKAEKKVLPELNDKFVSDTTEFETLDEYKKDIKERLSKKAQEEAERNYEVELLDEIVSRSKIDLSEALIDQEVERIVHDFEHRLSHQNLSLEVYLQYIGTTLEKFKAERREDAEKNVKTRLVVQKIISENKLQVTTEELDASISNYAKSYGMTAEDFKKNLGTNDIAYFENEALMNKVLTFIKNQNK